MNFSIVKRHHPQWRIQNGPDPPLLKPAKYKIKLLTHKIYCNNWIKINFLSKLNIKLLGGREDGIGMNISRIFLF